MNSNNLRTISQTIEFEKNLSNICAVISRAQAEGRCQIHVTSTEFDKIRNEWPAIRKELEKNGFTVERGHGYSHYYVKW